MVSGFGENYPIALDSAEAALCAAPLGLVFGLVRAQSGLLREHLAAGAGAARIPGKGDDPGTMNEAIAHRRGDDLVGKALAPTPEKHIPGSQKGTMIKAGGDELAEQVRSIMIEGQLFYLVDNQELVYA